MIRSMPVDYMDGVEALARVYDNISASKHTAMRSQEAQEPCSLPMTMYFTDLA